MMNDKYLINECGLTPLFLKNRVSKASELANKIIKKIEQNKSFIFFGNVGCGKTHLAQSIVYELANKNKKVLYVQLSDCINYLRQTTIKSAETESAAINNLVSLDLIIFDECFELSEYATNIFFNIIDKRYYNLKSTILITSCSQQRAIKIIDNRIISRFYDFGGGFLEVKGNDRRLK